MEEVTTNYKLEEFTSELEEQIFYYQIVRMVGSAYVWVGQQAGAQGCVVTAITPRIPVPGHTAATSLVGGGSETAALGAAARLNAKLSIPLILALDVPEDPKVISHVESEIVARLS